MTVNRCLFCGGDVMDPDHLLHCDGQQGQAEAEIVEAEEEDTDIELHARRSDPETSHEAMAAFDPERMKSAVNMAVELHKRLGPMADFQFRSAWATAWTGTCCDHLYQQARSSARDQGWIRDSGVRLVNPETRRRQVVWMYNAERQPPVLEYCNACGALLARDGKRRRKERGATA